MSLGHRRARMEISFVWVFTNFEAEPASLLLPFLDGGACVRRRGCMVVCHTSRGSSLGMPLA